MADRFGSHPNARRAIGACFLAVVLIGLAEAQEPKITVLVYNRSQMRRQTLLQGEQIAKHILEEVGVYSTWVDCLLDGSNAHFDDCSGTANPTRLVLTVVKRWKSPVNESSRLGLAIQDAGGSGAYCYLFEERLDQVVQASHINPARLLGHAMAHELGHLLKGSNSHSAQGLMSAHWYRDEVGAAARLALGFTQHDATQIRRRLSGYSAPI